MSDFFTTHYTLNETTGAAVFRIVERPTAYSEPTKTKSGWTAVSKRDAWQRARSQAAPVEIVPLVGLKKQITSAFDGPTFERAAYSGYVQYGLSMTDGHYAPMKFDQWVIHFRKTVLNSAFAASVWAENDAPDYVRGALTVYRAELQKRINER